MQIRFFDAVGDDETFFSAHKKLFEYLEEIWATNKSH